MIGLGEKPSIWWYYGEVPSSGCSTVIQSQLLVRDELKKLSFGFWTLLITDTGIDLAVESCKPGFRTGITGTGTNVGNVILDKFTTLHFCGGNWMPS